MVVVALYRECFAASFHTWSHCGPSLKIDDMVRDSSVVAIGGKNP